MRRMQSTIGVFAFMAFAALSFASPATAAPVVPSLSKVSAGYGKLPLTFEKNEGQAGKEVKFLSRGQGYSLFLTGNAAVLSLTKQNDNAVVRWQTVGGNRNPRVTGDSPVATTSNYFHGNDPKKWHTSIANYGKVRYEGVYPGTDLIYHGNQRQVEYDFVVAPSADPKRIRLAFTGIASMHIGAGGELILKTPLGDLVQPRPLIYQEIAGQRRQIEGGYALRASHGTHEVGFVVGAYDRTQPLVIDPTLLYSTYLGSNDLDEGLAIAVDASGNAYVTGLVASTTFPGVTGSSLQPSSGGDYDIFVTKINAGGTAIVYSTFLGGSGGNEYGLGITVDSSGNVYVTGATNSASDFPGITGSSIQPTYGGYWRDAFATKINAAGNAIVYSTFLGGSGDDLAWAIAVDSSGNAYVGGSAGSTDFPTTSGTIQPTSSVGGGFVSKINPAGTAFVYSTYLGDGSGVGALTTDSSGNAYVAGSTGASTFPGVSGSSLQPSNAGGGSDGFITKINPAGTATIWSTFLGDTGSDSIVGIARDGSGNIIVTGDTDSTSFPGVTGSSIQSTNTGSGGTFVTKLNSSASAIVWSTFLGGNDLQLVANAGIGVDGSGNVFVAGATNSTTFTGVDGTSMQPAYGGAPADAYLTEINAAGTAIVFSTFLGGTDDDEATGLAVDSSGNAYLTGWTSSVPFPGVTAGSIQPTYGDGGRDGFVVKIGEEGSLNISSISPTSGISGTNVTINGTGFHLAQGSGAVWLGSTYGTVVSWSDTQIVATIASGATSGVEQVYQGGVWSNTISLTVVTPHITSITPTSGPVGTSVTFTGTGFRATQGSGSVWLGSNYGTVTSWSDTQIVATVATGATSGVAQVYQGGVWSNTNTFTVTTMSITSISPTSGVAGTSITINGTLFGASQGSGNVWLGSKYGTVVSWSDTQVVATIASGATSGVAQILQNGVWSNTISLTVITPNITSISPSSGYPGTSVTINGTGFQSSQGSGAVWLGSTYGTVTSWSDTQIVATVAATATSGVAQVYQGGVWSNTTSFTVVRPTVTSISPTSGYAGTSVTVNGTSFGASQGSGAVWLGSKYGTVTSWSDTQIVATIASGATSGVAQVYQASIWSNAISLTVITPHITSISPANGSAGTQVTITGTGFQSSQGSGAVWLGSKYGTVVSWSDTQVVAAVASGATSGVAQVYQGGVWSNTNTFSVP